MKNKKRLDKALKKLDKRRVFSIAEKMYALIMNFGKCDSCDKWITIDECQGGHDIAYSEGGLTEDCIPLCKTCNGPKGCGTKVYSEWKGSEEHKEFITEVFEKNK
jgi:hypothetical protein